MKKSVEPKGVAAAVAQPLLLPRKVARGGPAGLFGKCGGCEEVTPAVERRRPGRTEPEGGTPLVGGEQHTQSLSPEAPGRGRVESRPGHDFGRVRVRTDGGPLSFQFSPLPESRLPAQTPAWTQNGQIHLGPAGLLMSRVERQRVLRHEMVHAVHQRLAPNGETAGARQHAEGLAERGQAPSGGFDRADFLRPAPALLAYPPKNYPPWSKVWIGHAGLLGEITEAGVTVRIFLDYDKDLGIKSRPEHQVYDCSKRHDPPPIPDVVKKMKKAAQVAAEMNKRMPSGAKAQRVALVAIFGDKSNSAYRSAGGQGLIVLSREEFDAGLIESTVGHEGGHAVFEFHSVRGDADASTRTPDALALQIADLYAKLAATKPVPLPTSKFDKKSPPPLTDKQNSGLPAGIVMVTDTLWAGSGGHPWDNVDEFFASAYAGYVQQPALLKEIIKYYEKHDKAIKPLAAELLKLLAMVGEPKKYGGLKAPEKPDAAKQELARVDAPLVFTKEHYMAGWFVDPSSMPSPDSINCAAKTSTDEDIDKLLEPEKKPEDVPAEKPKK